MGATLDYQNHDDARRETGVLRKLFGPSKEEVWARLADQIGARLEKGSWWNGSRVVADVGPWQLVLDAYTESAGETSTTYTRMRAPYANRDELHFTCPGVVKDVQRLRQLYDLFAEVLHVLCHTGSAYESDPGIRI